MKALFCTILLSLSITISISQINNSNRILCSLKTLPANGFTDRNNVSPELLGLSDSEVKSYGIINIKQVLYAFKETPTLLKMIEVRIDASSDIELLFQRLENESSLNWVSQFPDPELATPPNDPEYTSGNQYHLDLIQAPLAWNHTEGSADVVVAVPDVACQIDHPDLINKIHLNQDEIPNDGIDNDNNGYIDDYYGYSPEHESGNFSDLLPNPSTQTHGTKVCGAIAAETNNSLGVASVGNKIKVLPVDISADGGSSIPYTFDAWNYLYTRRADIDVINCSWGGAYNGVSQAVLDDYEYIINTFKNAGIIILGAAGNNDDTEVYYPGKFNNAVSVAATDEMDIKHSASNYHTDDVDVSAPGAPFRSLNTGTGYTNFSHTSAATPIASAICGLMRSVSPNITVDEMKSCLISSADQLNGPLAPTLGAGRVNAYQCVLCALDLATTDNEVNLTEKATFFPNPSRTGFFEYSSSKSQPIAVHNLLGQKIDISIGENQLDLSNQPNGIYIITLSNKTNIRLIKN